MTLQPNQFHVPEYAECLTAMDPNSPLHMGRGAAAMTHQLSVARRQLLARMSVTTFRLGLHSSAAHNPLGRMLAPPLDTIHRRGGDSDTEVEGEGGEDRGDEHPDNAGAGDSGAAGLGGDHHREDSVLEHAGLGATGEAGVAAFDTSVPGLEPHHHHHHHHHRHHKHHHRHHRHHRHHHHHHSNKPHQALTGGAGVVLSALRGRSGSLAGTAYVPVWRVLSQQGASYPQLLAH